MKKITFGSVLIGFLTLALASYSIYSGIVRLGLMETNYIVLGVFLTLGSAIGIFLGIKYPIATEFGSFVLTALIFIQATWDTIYDITEGIQSQRVMVLIIALLIFILNMYTGKLTKKSAKKQLRRTLGIN